MGKGIIDKEEEVVSFSVELGYLDDTKIDLLLLLLLRRGQNP
jgi:hypothetical protein